MVEFMKKMLYHPLHLGRLGDRNPVEGDTAMSRPTFFVQECPTCGRSLEIRVEYLGKVVHCQHCRGQLLASDRVAHVRAAVDDGAALLLRAEQLLAEASRHAHPPTTSLAPSQWAAARSPSMS